MEATLERRAPDDTKRSARHLVSGFQVLPLIPAVHLLIVLLYAASDPALAANAVVGALAAGALVVLTVACARRLSVGPERARQIFAVLLITFVATRLAWTLAVRPLPLSDFAGYLALAEMIANGGPIFLPWPIGGVVAAWGYSLVLGLVLALFPAGWSVPIAQLLNVALGCAALAFLHRLVARVAGDVPALLAAALFLIWPAQLYLTPVLASEHLGIVVLLGTLLCALPLLERARDASVGRAMATGGLLAACLAIRSPLVSTTPAVLIAAWRWRTPRARTLMLMAAVLVGLLAGTLAYRTILGAGFGAAPQSGLWWSLLTGTNVDSGGSLSRRDQAMFFRGPSLEAANERARAEILRRVQSDPVALLRIAARKSIGLWISDDYAVLWGRQNLAPSSFEPSEKALSNPAHVVHLALLALAALGCARLARAPATPTTDLLVLVLICGTLVHMVAECQARYHYVFEPLLIALGVLEIARRPPATPSAVV